MVPIGSRLHSTLQQFIIFKRLSIPQGLGRGASSAGIKLRDTVAIDPGKEKVETLHAGN